MKIISTYPAKIKESSGAFEATAVLYRQAVDYFIGIMLKHWDGSFSAITNSTFVVRGDCHEFCVHGIIGARYTGTPHEHDYQETNLS